MVPGRVFNALISNDMDALQTEVVWYLIVAAGVLAPMPIALQ